jgi:FecR protein
MRFPVSGLLLGTWALGLAAGSACAQYVISAHAGVVQYVEGRAYLNDQVVEPKFGQFPDIKENQEFRTEEGRAEILLTPGVFLRLGENSSIRMLSTHLTDTKVEVLSGSAMVECNDVPKDNSIQAIYKGNAIRFDKQGLYRIDTEPARLKVYEGEAVVTDSAGQLTLRGGKETSLSGVLVAESFDRKDQDSLYSWSDRRAAYVSQANIASASAVSNNGYSGYGGGYGGYGLFGNSGYGYNGLGYGPSFLGGWMFNPMFGMYTYMPYSGFGYSPFGYTYYSPTTVVYAPVHASPYTGSSGGRVSAITGASRMANLAAANRGSALSAANRGSSASHFSFGGGGHSSAGHR